MIKIVKQREDEPNLMVIKGEKVSDETLARRKMLKKSQDRNKQSMKKANK